MLSKVDNSNRRRPRVVVVGAGIGGLVASLMLAAEGVEVDLVEKAGRPGGKLREVVVDGVPIDSGPTVFTMRWVFDAIFAAAGTRLEDHLRIEAADLLARHHWPDGSTFDLHADIDRTADAVAAFAGPDEAQRYRAFCRRTADVFETLNGTFMEAQKTSPFGLARAAGLGGLAALTRIKPFASLWSVVGHSFRDPRLRQLFGRYATYCGSSPYLAPGPLMLIAHVEQKGVWTIDGGMHRLAEALELLAADRGVAFHYGAEVSEILVADGRAAGVRLASGETIGADAVVFNGDPAALFTGRLGAASRTSVPAWTPADRSLSALTWSMRATARGFPLSRHTVFFSGDYRREFDQIAAGRLPSDPTIYVCAQDRAAGMADEERGPERLFVLVNAPANADSKPLDREEIAACETRVMQRLAQAGLTLSATHEQRRVTTPTDFAALFPATGGALYGRASHGWAASFQRPGAATRIAGLFLAGGAVHPGPGLPMAALSGRHAAAATATYLASTAMSRPPATRGGTSTRSATTASTR